MNRLSATILRNSAFSLGAQLLIKSLSFIFSVLVVRNLGVESYGQYAAVLAFGATFSIFSDLGLAPYAVRQIARWREDAEGSQKVRDLYADLLGLRLGLSVVTIGVLILSAWVTGRSPILIGAIALNSISLIFYAFQGSNEAILAGMERLDLTAGSRVINQVVFVLMGALALWAGAGYFGLIGANLVAVFLMVAACWRLVRSLGIRPGSLNPTRWVVLLRASIPFGIIGLALGLSYKFDTVLLSIYRGDAETGYYNAAYNLVFSMILISNVINTSLYPSLSRQFSGDQTQHFHQVFTRILRYLLILCLPIAAGGSILAGQIIPFLYTQSYIPAIPVLRLIIWVVPLMFISEFLGYMIAVLGREKQVARAVLISTGVNVLANLILVPRFGLMAAAVMTVLTEVILVIQQAVTLRTSLPDKPMIAKLLPPFGAVIAMAVVVGLVHTYLSLELNILIGGFVYGIVLVLLGGVDKEDLGFVVALRRRKTRDPVTETQ